MVGDGSGGSTGVWMGTVVEWSWVEKVERRKGETTQAMDWQTEEKGKTREAEMEGVAS